MMFFAENITKPTQAESMKNQQKAQNITEPTEPKTLICFSMLQNQSYLENQIYKTISFIQTCLKNALITNRIVSKISWNEDTPKLNTGIRLWST